MTVEDVRAVPYGRPATVALSEAVAAGQAAHPLDPVTVVVPSNLAGLSARRLLGGGSLGGTGVANVAFVTPFRLAELLCAGHLGGQRPLTNPVLRAAVRAALGEEPGGFAEVADHPATEAALVALYGELSHARPHTLARIAAAGRRGSEVVRLHRSVHARLAGFAGEDDLAAAARARIDAVPSAGQALGRVVWHLPDRLTPAMAALLSRLLAVAPASAVVGLTGRAEADAAVVSTCAAAGVAVTVPAAMEPATGTRIISASDADEEVRAVIREVMALAEAGTPLDRIGVLYPMPDPYARTLRQQLGGAGIPHNGPSRARLSDSATGRTLLAALSLPAEGWGRAAVLSLLSGAPVRHGGRPAPAARWEALSRRAGVVGGLDDWRDKLGALEAEDGEAASLAAFVDRLATDLDRVQRARRWAERSQAARRLLGWLLGPEQRRVGWPDHEVDAADRVDAVLARLAVLDDVEPGAPMAAFGRAVIAELDEPTARIGRFGEGVLLGPLASAPGLDLDAVFVLGMAEGTCPAPWREDALLPDEDRRRAVMGELAGRPDCLHDQHRAFLAALAAGGEGHRVLVHPRGDLRTGRARRPSRWLLDTASALAGTRVHSSDYAALGPPVVAAVASFLRGVADAPVAASPGERALAVVLAHIEAGGAAEDAVGVPSSASEADLVRGLACLRARRGAAFTVWDGNLAGQPVPSPAAGEVCSASALETWAACPRRYFLSHVLHLRDRPDPERVSELGPADRGLVVHEILERFVGEAIARPGGPPAPGLAWSSEDRARLHELAGEVFARYEREGRTGAARRWRWDRQQVRRDLDGFLHHDDDHRARAGGAPRHVEMAFGHDGGAGPVPVDLGGARTVRFRGTIDRVDVAGDGRYVVLDYKTGRAERFGDLEGDPVREGTLLQLGVYAEAVQAALGATDVEARYWNVTSRGRFEQSGYVWTAERRERFLAVVEAIVDGIEAGTYPARPGPYDPFFRTHSTCRHCPFDRLCPRDREDQEAAKAGAPELAVLSRLHLPDDDPEVER